MCIVSIIIVSISCNFITFQRQILYFRLQNIHLASLFFVPVLLLLQTLLYFDFKIYGFQLQLSIFFYILVFPIFSQIKDLNTSSSLDLLEGILEITNVLNVDDRKSKINTTTVFLEYDSNV